LYPAGYRGRTAAHEGTWNFANPYYITGCREDGIIMAGKINFNKPAWNQDIYILKFDKDG
jgi:hypothetical protein